MSKYISSNQLWDNIQNQFSPKKEREFGSFQMEQDFGKMSISHFSTGQV